MNRKMLGASGSDWLAASRFLVFVTFMNLFFVSEDTAIAMVIPQTFYLCTQNWYFAAIALGLCWMGMGIWSPWYDGEKII